MSGARWACLGRDGGFTIVELMVVVLIVGILITIAIPVFNAARAVTRERACHANMRTIEGAVQQYLASNPTNSQDQCEGVGWVAALVGANKQIVAEPKCPTANAQYDYDATSGTAACTNPAADGGPHDHF